MGRSTTVDIGEQKGKVNVGHNVILILAVAG